MRRFDYYAPSSLAEATTLLAQKGEGGRPLAGGTDLIVQMRERARNVPFVVSLRNVRELQGFEFQDDGSLRIGSMTTAGSLAWSPEVKSRMPGIVDGADLVGSVQVRNRATIGGNLCNASPACDTAPVFIAMDAHAHIAGLQGERTVPLAEFFKGPSQTVLQPGEVLVALHVPAPQPHSGAAYLRHTVRREMDIAFVGVAVSLVLSDDHQTIKDARVVLGAVAPTPLRSNGAEQALIGKPFNDDTLRAAAEAAAQDARPITDVRASADYRRELVRVYVRRAAKIAAERALGIRAGSNGHGG